MRVAVVTVVAGRHDHLRRQRLGLAAGERRPDRHVVVAMDDPAIRGVVDELPGDSTVVDCPCTDGNLPLAAARNLGAEVALAGGAELLVFLDVDCIPGPALVRRYVDAATQRGNADSLLCGPVTYLPPAGAGGYPSAGWERLASPHPARPDPVGDSVEVGRDYDLFWSLSFAARASTWRTLGGFCEDYTGYGGEDTDLARTARAGGIGLRWVGGAHAFHQYHPVSNPPVEHLDAILRNAATFHRRWGSWPMPGWLAAFASAGLAELDPIRSEWVRTAARD